MPGTYPPLLPIVPRSLSPEEKYLTMLTCFHRLPHLSPYLQGFDTMCLHAGYNPVGDDAVYGLGQGAPRGVPLHRTAPYQVHPVRAIFRCYPPRSRFGISDINFL